MKIIALLLALFLAPCLADDTALAEGLAAAGVKHLSAGRTEQAEDCFYRALAHDEKCGVALFELAKIYDRHEQKTEAITFYQRAIQTKIDGSSKTYAQSRCVALNPFAPKLSALLDEYAKPMADARRTSGTIATAIIDKRLGDLGMVLAAKPSSPPVRSLYGEPIAAVEIKEQMGYQVGVLSKDCLSHTTQQLKYSLIPDALNGLQYTLIVPHKISDVSITFVSSGVVFALVNRGAWGLDMSKISEVGKKTTMPDVYDGEAMYSVWTVSGKAGDQITVANHPIIALKITKK